MNAVTLFLLTLTFPAAPEAERTTEFERKVRPLLVAQCYGCHSEAAGKRRGDLLLDRRSGWVEGGSRGPAIVPGNPEASLLLHAVSYKDPKLRMPPKGKLSPAELSILERWISSGAPAPRAGATSPREGATPNDAPPTPERDDFWSFQPLTTPFVPDVEDKAWPRTEVDRFLLARLEREGIAPVADASRGALVRRLYFDLVGLPPSPDAITGFVSDASPDALERLVDRLIGSPRFGERWGQHWLDAARFAESSGGGRSLMFRNAWRYRDYVIDSFNRDKPYDRFVLEQIAGDLLPYESAVQRDEQITATAYLTLGPTNYELQDKTLLRMEVVDEQIDTVGRTFLAMTLGCARCHDHKFDPIPTADYYALAGIFRSTKTITPGNVSGYVERPLSTTPEHQAAHDRHRRETADLNKQLTEAREAHQQLTAESSTVQQEDRKEQIRHVTRTIGDLKERLAALKKDAPRPIPRTMSVRDEETPEDWHVLVRGGVRDLGPKIRRGFLTALEPVGLSATAELSSEHSGRLELARWLVDARNSLASRVVVNRIWHHLFGEGLVRTTDNFGHKGELPSHPALLDHLARRFIEDGRSVKRLVREVVLSRAYGLAAAPPAATDPENRLCSRARRKRIDAEGLRDGLLAVSGLLDGTAGGLTIRKFSEYDLGYEFDTRRRSIYVPRFRNAVHEVFEIFDAATPNVVTGRRPESTLATQALYLLNSPLITRASKTAAARLVNSRLGVDDALHRVYLETLGRPPSSEEYKLSLRHLGTSREAPEVLEERWSEIYHALFASLDFRYLH